MDAEKLLLALGCFYNCLGKPLNRLWFVNPVTDSANTVTQNFVKWGVLGPVYTPMPGNLVDGFSHYAQHRVALIESADGPICAKHGDASRGNGTK